MACRVLRINNTSPPQNFKSSCYVHRKHASWEIEKRIDLDDDINRQIYRLEVDDLDRYLDNPQKKAIHIKQEVKKITYVFTDRSMSERILRAGAWLFDSYCGHNELLSFVQATVALEIILGDKNESDRVGIGALLGNRCAYLISKTHDQREENEISPCGRNDILFFPWEE